MSPPKRRDSIDIRIKKTSKKWPCEICRQPKIASLYIFKIMSRFFIVVFLIFCFLATSAQKERSFQVWNQNSFEFGLSENTWIQFSEKIHYTPYNQMLDLKFIDAFLAREFNDWLELGGGYRVAGINNNYGWLTEQRSMVYGNVFKESRKLEFKFSNRFEFRAFDKTANHFRHKQQLTLEFPALTAWNFRFYLAEETFQKFNAQNLHLARFYAGVRVFEFEHLQMKMYYILEKFKNNNLWNTRDIAGLNLSVEI